MPGTCRLIPASWPPLRSPGRSFRVGTWPGTRGPRGCARGRAREGTRARPSVAAAPSAPGAGPGSREAGTRPVAAASGRAAGAGRLPAGGAGASRALQSPASGHGARALRGPRPRLWARCAAVGRPCPRSRVAGIAAAAAGYASPAAARSDSAHRRPPSLSFCKNTVYSTRRTHSRAHTLTHTHTQTRARARKHTHHTHTYTHARTHALTRARNPGPPRAHARERASEQDAHTRRAKFRSLAWLLGTFTRYGEAGARAAPGNRAWPSWCERSPEPAGGGAGDWRAAGGLEGGGGPEGGGGDRRVAGAGRASRRRLPRRPLPLSLSLAHTLSYSIYFAALERGRRKPGGAGAEGGKVAVPGRCLLSPDEPPRVWKKKKYRLKKN